MAKLIIKHYGKIVNGRKEYYNFTLYKKQLYGLEGKEFVEIIEEKHRKVTQDQYGYLYGAIYATCLKHEYFAHFANEEAVHTDFFAPMFLQYSQRVITPEASKIIYKTRSTADLTRKEFGEFIEKVIAWCDENFEPNKDGSPLIPSPDQYHSRYYKTIDKTK